MGRTPEEHLDLIRAACGARPVITLPVADAVGRALAADVLAPGDSPAFDNSQMDGYALGEAHLGGGAFDVGPTVAAGVDPDSVLPGGVGDSVVPIMTGAKLPRGTAAVVPVERCTPGEFVEHGVVTVPAVDAGQFMRLRGSDIAAGDVLFRAGHVVNARTVAAAALLGVSEVPVERPARIVVCTGGDEVGGSGVASVPDANGPLIAAMAREAGISVAGFVSTPDDPDVLTARLRSAVASWEPDAFVTSGGISHGKREVVRQVLEPRGGWFGHVAQQPGGPQGLSAFEGVPVVSLPGNPVSTAVSFQLFVAPVLGAAPEPVSARLEAAAAGLAGRDCFYRGVLSSSGGELSARVVGGAGSHLLAQSAEANCLVRVPAGEDLAAGASVVVYPW